MKEKLKRILLACALVVSLAVLGGCSGETEEAPAIDPANEAVLNQQAEAIVQALAVMGDDEIEESIEVFNDEQMTVYASGYNSWKSAKKDLGALQSVISTETVMTEDKGYETTLVADFAERECTMFIGLDRKGNLTEMTFTPDYTVGELMMQAAGNLVVGMGTVFVVLIVIMLCISAFKFIPQDLGQKKAKEAAPVPIAPAAPAAVPAAEASQDEIAAVIAAAIAAYQEETGSIGGTPCANGITIRSIRRVPNAQRRR